MMNARLRRSAFAAISACATLALCSAARADEFLLASGGRIIGEVVNSAQTPRTEFVIRLPTGGTLSLRKDQVADVVRAAPEAAEYQTVRHKYPDTVEGQWALAEWCKEHKLTELRRTHLQRVIELNPDHQEARASLGYSRLDGEWQTQAEFLSSQGLVLHEGRWRYPQWIEITEAKEKADRERQQWYGFVRTRRDWLAGPKSAVAEEEILKIDDPAALPALQEYMNREQDENVRKLFVQAVANIGTSSAMFFLADRSLNDPSQEIRLTCLETLAERPRPEYVDYYIKQLQSKDNVVVNRAAIGLSHFKDPRSTAPLIDALTTSHQFAVTTGTPGGGMSATQGSGPGFGGSTFSSGSSTRIVTETLENAAVLETLVTLVGGRVNYRYDEALWKQWYSSLKKARLIDVRRS